MVKLNEIKPSHFKDIKKDLAHIDNHHEITFDKVLDYFNRQGFKYVDSGNYSTVYESPDGRYVIKVGYLDDCYKKFVRFVNKHKNNPNYPRISNIYEISEAVFIVFVEKLEPLKGNISIDLFKILTKIYFYGALLKKRQKQSYQQSVIDEITTELDNYLDDLKQFYPEKTPKEHIRDYFELFVSLQKIKRAIPKCFMDIHSGNFMYRKSNNKIVIIDPVGDTTKY